MDEPRLLRERLAATQAALDAAQADQALSSSAAVFGVTTTVNTYPTTAGAFYAVTPSNINGSETEGATYVTATGAAILYAWNAGMAVPPNGTPIVAHAVGGRWVFRYDG